MDKTVSTQIRTYQKDGKWIEETVETTVVETKDGKKTTTKTTTRQLSDPPSSGGRRRGSRSSSSSSSSRSRSPSPRRGAKEKSGKKGASSSHGGLISRIKNKARDSSSSDDEQDDYDKTFAKDVMTAVNEKRKIHGVKRLGRSRKLNQEARQWARHLAAMDKMDHKDEKDLGQNIYRLTAILPVQKSHVTGVQVVDQWYSQSEKYKFGEEPTFGPLETGHFCQMVWKDTKKMGVGIAINDNQHNIYVVAFFTPKGNYKGEFATQVPPVGGFHKESMLSNLTHKLRRASIGGSSSSSSDEDEDFNEAVLKSHNQYRAKHGVPPLKLSKKLNKAAEGWAKSIAKKDHMENNPSREYGENIYAKWSSNPKHVIPGKEAVESWYSDVSDHIFGEEPKPLTTGNFTQVVWESSKELGVGLARNKGSGKVYVVCFYEPAGNLVGGFTKNVAPPKK